MASIYVHIPFCLKKCAYCDFASYPGMDDMWEAYFSALETEIREWISRVGDKFDTAYIGGGTPSLVPARYIENIAKLFAADEFSLEANPGTLTGDKLKAYLDCGVNRISIGAQAFDDDILKKIGRIHAAREAETAVDMARAAGFRNINIDLMYALPDQTPEIWRATLDRAIALKPEHISAYSLIIEQNTPIAKTARDMDEDIVNDMQREASRALADAGYIRYEISNYARAGRECRHNIVYWTRGEYVGVGCAAHSFFGGERFRNHDNVREYIAGKRRLDVVKIDEIAATEEAIMLGTRMARGVSVDMLPDMRRAEKLVAGGLANIENGFFSLNEGGMELQNACVMELLGY